MIKYVQYFAVVAVVWAVVVGHPIAVWAHGVGSREMDSGAARAMEFLYSDGEPMAFARIQVTAPGEGGVFQSAHADARGRFAFVPAGPGEWTVAASDGQGHRAVHALTVAAEKPGAAKPAGPQVNAAIGPTWNGVALGVSLLANVALGAALLRRRRKGRSPS
jgi:nickel transport protein